MVFFIFALITVLCCYKWADWVNWKTYYPTMLYFFISYTVSAFLMYNEPLWAYNAFIYKYPVLDIALSAILYPSTALLFLSLLPKTKWKTIFYMAFWIALYTGIELIAFLLNDFVYYNNWNIIHSFIFNCVMFPIILLAHRKPLLIWPISSLIAFAFLWLFDIPLSRM